MINRCCVDYNRSGEDIAQVIKEFTFFRQEYTVEGLGWTVEGDFWAHEYQITSERGVVATISKHWFTWGDSSEIRRLAKAIGFPMSRNSI